MSVYVFLLMPCLHVALSGKATGMHFQKSQKEQGLLFFLLPCAGRGAGPRGSPGPGLPLHSSALPVSRMGFRVGGRSETSGCHGTDLRLQETAPAWDGVLGLHAEAT